MKSIVKKDIRVESRGLVVLFPEPMNPKAIAVLKGNQLTVDKESSEPLTREDFGQEGTLVLTMTERECRSVRERFDRNEHVWSIGEFVRKRGDIAEPHGGTLAEYGAVYEYLDLMVKMVAEIVGRINRAEEDAEQI